MPLIKRLSISRIYIGGFGAKDVRFDRFHTVVANIIHLPLTNINYFTEHYLLLLQLK